MHYDIMFIPKVRSSLLQKRHLFKHSLSGCFHMQFRKVLLWKRPRIELFRNWLLSPTKLSIITTSGGGYCWVRSLSHRCGNTSDHDKQILPLHCTVMLETVYVWSQSVKWFIVLCGNALVKVRHKIFITDKTNQFLVWTCCLFIPCVHQFIRVPFLPSPPPPMLLSRSGHNIQAVQKHTL